MWRTEMSLLYMYTLALWSREDKLRDSGHINGAAAADGSRWAYKSSFRIYSRAHKLPGKYFCSRESPGERALSLAAFGYMTYSVMAMVKVERPSKKIFITKTMRSFVNIYISHFTKWVGRVNILTRNRTGNSRVCLLEEAYIGKRRVREIFEV